MDRTRNIVACLAFALCSYYYLRKVRQRRARRRKVLEINRRRKVEEINRNRKKLGFYKTTFLPMKQKDPKQFFKYTRMTVHTFNKLLLMIFDHLTGKQLPDSVCPGERLAVTLHYLSQGTTMQTIAMSYQLDRATVHKIIKETSVILWNVLAPLYLKSPSSTGEWEEISNGFYTKCHFPNCVGALDGKHLNIQPPAQSGPQCSNYKKSFCTVLMASCDANYNFTLVDIGIYSSRSDGGIFREPAIGTGLDTGRMNLPQPTQVPNSQIKVPYVFVAYEPFPLKSCIMRPFPGWQLDEREKIFNYRLSLARRAIENTFGILVARWRILKQTIYTDVKTVDDFVKAVVCLHNYVNNENRSLYCPPGYTDSDTKPGDWRLETTELVSVGRLSCNNTCKTYNIRDIFADYFISPEGEDFWQYEHLHPSREPCNLS